MNTVYGFDKKEDLERVLRMVAESENSQSRSVVSPSHVRQEAKYAKILTILNNSGNAEHDNKEATAVEAVWDKTNFEFKVVETNPVSYDDEGLKDSAATVFSTNNITSKSAMAVNDIVLLQQYPHLSETSGWLVVETGGGAEFGLCTITAMGDNNKEYKVNVQVGNPKLTPAAELPKGILYLDFATTNAVAIGGKIQAILYPSTKPTVEPPNALTYDCIAIETLYNLITPPEPAP